MVERAAEHVGLRPEQVAVMRELEGEREDGGVAGWILWPSAV